MECGLKLSLQGCVKLQYAGQISITMKESRLSNELRSLKVNNIWDVRFLELAKHVSTWSKDPSTQVGCVIANDRYVIGLGYNGFPKGIQDSSERLENRELKYKYVVHAEPNAIANARGSVEGATAYTYPFAPCSECMKILITNGIKRIVYPPASQDLIDRWGANLQFSAELAREAGIELVELAISDNGSTAINDNIPQHDGVLHIHVPEEKSPTTFPTLDNNKGLIKSKKRKAIFDAVFKLSTENKVPVHIEKGWQSSTVTSNIRYPYTIYWKYGGQDEDFDALEWLRSIEL